MKKICLTVAVILAAVVAGPAHSHAQTLSSGDNSFLLRANLIQWVTLTPDLGVEYRYKETYAVLLSGSTTAGLVTFGSGLRWGMTKYNPEVRYYIGAAKQWYAGVGYQRGTVNFYNPANNIGRQADFFAAGLTGGYMLPLGERWSLDFNIGLGYAWFDNYQRYYKININGADIFMFRGARNKSLPTVTQVGVNLVWKI